MLRVSAVVIRDAAGSILTVRKRGTVRFMLPGGKPEPGETPRETAIRECTEELSVVLDPGALRDVGVFRAPAANEPGIDVEATVFEHPTVEVTSPAAEIAELRWLAPEQRPADLAPLLAQHVLPAIGC